MSEKSNSRRPMMIMLAGFVFIAALASAVLYLHSQRTVPPDMEPLSGHALSQTRPAQ